MRSLLFDVKIVAAYVLFALLAMPTCAMAQATYTWTGTSSNWLDPANWQSNGVPAGAIPDNTVSVVIGFASTPAPINPVIDAGQSVTSGALSYVGNTAPAALTVQNGGQWIAAGNMTAGYSVQGAITIQNGGIIRNSIGYMGFTATGNGLVTVTGPGSQWVNTSALNVGQSGAARLTIEDAGFVSSTVGYIGYNASANGTVTVTGGNGGTASRWTMTATNGLNVGYGGRGTLNILQGGIVTDINGSIGTNAGSNGVVGVSGAGSSWANTGTLSVGYQGSGLLTIANGGSVSATGGVNAGGSGGTGVIAIGAAQGDAAAAPGTLTTSGVTLGAQGSLVFNHTSNNYVFAPIISGNGSVRQIAGTTVLTGTNTYSGATNVVSGMLTLTGAGVISDASLVNIADGATFAIDRTTANSGNYVFANSLTGAGLLSVKLTNPTNTFSFRDTTGSAFTGTVFLENSTFALSGNDAAAVRNATLLLGTGSITTVGAGVQAIGELGFDGGTLKFDATVPAQNTANGIIVANHLDLTGTGIVSVNAPLASGIINPPALNNANLLSQDDDGALTKLAGLASGGTIVGTGGALTLVDQNGDPLSNGHSVDIRESGATVAVGTYDYRLNTGTSHDGLYAAYTLQSVELLAGQTLTLTPGAGAAGLGLDLSATVTGAGNLAIAGGLGQVVSLSNASNDYTGTTTVASGTLQLGSNNALGSASLHTSQLTILSGAFADLNGYTQTIGSLAGTGALNMNGGSLTLDDGGTFDGVLTGAGALTVSGGVLSVTGADNGSLSASVMIAAGASVVLSEASGLGNTGTMTNASTLTFDGATGVFAKSVNGAGIVSLTNGANIVLTGVNGLSGTWSTPLGTTLTASNQNSLGTANVVNDGVLVVTATNDWTLDNSVTGNGVVVKNGAARVQADQSLALFSGTTQVNAGTLQFGDALAPGAIGGDVQVASGALLSGHGAIAGTLTNDGAVSLSGLSVGNRLIVSNYVGQGGTLALHIMLGDGSSQSDRLVIDGGTATGHSSLAIVNAGGLGAQTVGNGILVIETENGATTTQDSFQLSSRVAAGAYDYSLYRGDASGGGDDWYLRSLPWQKSDVRSEVPLMASVTPIAAEIGYAMVATWRDRIGDDGQAPFASTVKGQTASDPNQGVGWARVFGERAFVEKGDFGRYGPDYDYRLTGVQAGMDLLARQSDDGSLGKAGFYFGYANASGDAKGEQGAKAGSLTMNAYSVGAYGTHKAALGWYADAVAQGTWYQVETDSVEKQKATPDGFGFIASLESGYAFNLGGGVTLEPQVQMAYQRLLFDTARDNFGVFEFSDMNSLRGRFGLRPAKTWNVGDAAEPYRVTTWMSGNVWHEFMGDAKTTVSTFYSTNPVTTVSPLRGTWGEISAGVSGQLSNAVSLFAAASYSRSLDNKGRESWSERVGLKIRW